MIKTKKVLLALFYQLLIGVHRCSSVAKGVLLFLHEFMVQKYFWTGINGMDGDNCNLGLKALRALVDVVSKEKATRLSAMLSPSHSSAEAEPEPPGISWTDG